MLCSEYAAKALVKLGDARAVEPLTALLSDQGHTVRATAAEALELLTPRRLPEMKQEGSR